MKMTACQNFEKKRMPKKVMLSSDFAGVKAGMMLYVGTPQIVASFISKIPRGETSSVIKLRNQLARRNQCDAMCPVSTAIFLRIAAEYAIEQMDAGIPADEVIPFWRVIEPNGKIVKRLSIGRDWIEKQRNSEKSDQA
jgi:crotonobetainyl-CoA:carnitine CoA-transferase CaiB-like acyl-CoA transferase